MQIPVRMEKSSGDMIREKVFCNDSSSAVLSQRTTGVMTLGTTSHHNNHDGMQEKTTLRLRESARTTLTARRVLV